MLVGREVEFARSGYGWLTPTGDLLACGLHDHLHAVKVAGHMVEEIEYLAELTPEAIERDCEKLTAEVGATNAEWHRLEYASENHAAKRREIVDKLYQGGWVRLGLFQVDGQLRLEAEGTERALSRSERQLEALADKVGAPIALNFIHISRSDPSEVYSAFRR